MTPEEISSLTTSSASSVRTPLVEIINQGMVGIPLKEGVVEHQAKILPFNGNYEEVQREEIESRNKELEGPWGDFCVLCGMETALLLSDFYFYAKECEKNVFGQKRRPKVQKNRNKQISAFIIDEKKKLEKSYSRLKGREILALYQKNAEIDIEQEKSLKEDLSKSTKIGVLVNKKQA